MAARSPWPYPVLKTVAWGDALVPDGWEYWKWLLLALSCLLLMTGQVIDVASEVFEVDAAGDDDDMLVKYSGYVAVIASVAGTLLGQVAGSALANASTMAMLLTSSVLSFACALTRFRTREFMPGFGGDDAGGSGDGAADESAAADAAHTPQRATVTRSTRIRLLAASLLLALIPSLWASYALLGIGSRYGGDALTVVYAFGGVGGIVGSFVYMRLSARPGMRAVAAIGAAATALSLAAAALVLCAGFVPLLKAMPGPVRH